MADTLFKILLYWDSYGLDDRGFESRQGLGIFLFTTASRSALGPSQTPIQWVPGALSLEVKRLGLEADHLPPIGAEVKECVEVYIHSPNTPSWRDAQLNKKAQRHLYFYLYPYFSLLCLLKLFSQLLVSLQ
jgi:hypothetical protein